MLAFLRIFRPGFCAPLRKIGRRGGKSATPRWHGGLPLAIPPSCPVVVVAVVVSAIGLLRHWEPRSGPFPRDRFVVLGRFLTVPGPVEGPRRPKTSKNRPAACLKIKKDLRFLPPPPPRVATKKITTGGFSSFSASRSKFEVRASRIEVRGLLALGGPPRRHGCTQRGKPARLDPEGSGDPF